MSSNSLADNNRPTPSHAKSSPPRIALAGNPNSGKTTLFNALTGMRYKVANYPGVTVEKKTGRCVLSDNCETSIIDLPGIYSLSTSAIDERIATFALLGQLQGESLDALIVVVDATNLERNLYLVTQLIDTGIPLVLVLNMVDLAEKQGLGLHKEVLARALDVTVVSVVAREGKGMAQLKAELCRLLERRPTSAKRYQWASSLPLYREAMEIIGTRVAQQWFKPQPDSSESAQHTSLAPLLGAAVLSESLVCSDLSCQKLLVEARDKLQTHGIDSYTSEASLRYEWINNVVKRALVHNSSEQTRLAQRIDWLLTSRITGSLIFFLIMGVIFQSIFLWAQVPMDLIDAAISFLATQLQHVLPEGQLRSLVVDGIISGVGNVLVFVPQIAVLFFLLGILEDSGYLARAAFVMDRVMRPVGLQGRSFIPLLSSFACAIPGILSARTIPSWSDRIATIMVAPLMSCSARLPVYAVLIAACIPARTVWGVLPLQGLVLLGMYLLGIFAAALVAWLLRISALRGKPALFVMEMPTMRLPVLSTVLREVIDRVWSFITNAGTMILACSILLWFLASYPRPNPNSPLSRVQQSYAGQIGLSFEPAIKPLGFDWQIGVGILAAFAAREVFISALATVNNLDDQSDDPSSLIQTLKEKNATGEFSTLTAVSLMVFFVFACQCMSTLAVCRRETGSWSWTAFMFCYMTGLAYLSSLLTYQLGSALF